MSKLYDENSIESLSPLNISGHNVLIDYFEF